MIISRKVGGGVFSGTEYSRTVDNDYLAINGSSTDNNGAFLRLHGKNYHDTPYAGTVLIRAKNDSSEYDLFLKPDGTAKWGNKNLAMAENVIPRSGGAVITGGMIGRTINNSFLRLDGGSGWEQGASVVVSGKDRTDSAGGGIGLHASNGTQSCTMSLNPDGTATWGSKNLAMREDVVPRGGGSVLTAITIGRVDNSSYLNICGGLDWSNGATISLMGKDVNGGYIALHPNSGTLEKEMRLSSDGTWIWSGTAVQLISDQRLKQQISKIDNALLDAWEDVEPCQFKYNDAVNQKGDNARLHTGYVVQQIDEVCQKHNLDISEYGLYCHEEYPERTEEVEIKQEDGTIKKETKVIEEASEHYSLRYTETLVVECAYLRREVSRLKQQNEKLEQRLKILEQSVK